MNTKRQIKAYLPPSAPLNWELCDGTEHGLRVLVGFTTNWFHERAGVSFGERYHTDPYFRFTQLEKMQRYLTGAFPQIPCFQEHDLRQECATITGLYSTCPIAMIYGMHPIYRDNDWPAIHPRERFTLEELKDLEPISVADTPVMQDILRQIDILHREWGNADGCLNYQGVLNSTFKLLGDQVFLDMVSEPEQTMALFDHVARTTLEAVRVVETAQRASGFPDADTGLYTCISNCVVNMISPQFYEDLLLPYDKYVSDGLAHTGIHTCNWTVDKIVRSLTKIDRVSYVDFGFLSDFDLVATLLPDARKSVFYTPRDLVVKNDEALRQDLCRIKDAFHDCDICLADIDLNTPDDRIVKFVELAQEISEEG